MAGDRGRTGHHGRHLPGYILVLAAIPTICQFLKLAVFGYSVPFLGTMHIGIGFALSIAIRALSWARSSAHLSSRSSSMRWRRPSAARRTASRRSRWWPIRTPPPGSPGSPCCWAFLGFLIMLVGVVYGIYLLYLGLPVTMKCPPEKAGAYTAVTMICAIISVFWCSTSSARCWDCAIADGHVRHGA